MSCKVHDICGGCSLRTMGFEEYKKQKTKAFTKALSYINQDNISFGEAVFIPDGNRRRAGLSFEYKKKKLVFGFNQQKTNDVADINDCPLLTPKLNNNIIPIKKLLNEICAVQITGKIKNKITTTNISKGSVSMCEVDNGIDVVLNFEQEPNIEIKQIIFEFAQANTDIIRISQKKTTSLPDVIIEKTKPFINISGINVFIPPATFLQATKQAENKMIALVLKYLEDTQGAVADLFCGVGTFSYPLAQNIKNKITSVDSSAESLSGFQETINKNMVSNIKIINRNLFKYPLLEDELKPFKAIIFDPPRAGASTQVIHIKDASKVIAVSCNPRTFVNDANTLISNGYKLVEATLVDQFTYSNHSELVALFTK